MHEFERASRGRNGIEFLGRFHNRIIQESYKLVPRVVRRFANSTREVACGKRAVNDGEDEVVAGRTDNGQLKLEGGWNCIGACVGRFGYYLDVSNQDHHPASDLDQPVGWSRGGHAECRGNLALDKHFYHRPIFSRCLRYVKHALYSHIRALRHIRFSLTTETGKAIASAIVGSRLDYCNSLLAGTSVSNLASLQLVQNTLASIVVVAQKSCFDLITPVLSELHWLPVCHRINFKIATITHRVL